MLSCLPCQAFVSPIVLDEISRGDANAVQSRLEKVSVFPVLEILPEVRTLADAYHLAVASWHGIDFIVSWNCTHIVNGRIKMLIEEINARQGIRTPIICTPEELMEG